MAVWMNGCLDGYMDGCMDRWMGVGMRGRLEGTQRDERKEGQGYHLGLGWIDDYMVNTQLEGSMNGHCWLASLPSSSPTYLQSLLVHPH
jgi:hypothetical protein